MCVPLQKGFKTDLITVESVHFRFDETDDQLAATLMLINTLMSMHQKAGRLRRPVALIQ